MKLSWKIFISTLMITILTFSAGGYILVASIFQTALYREINSAQEENKMLRNYFQVVFPSIAGNNDAVSTISESIMVNFTNDNLTLRIYDEYHNIINESDNTPYGNNLFKQVEDTSLMYTITQYNNRKFLQVISVIRAADSKVYLESYRDITSLFDDRKNLFSIYKRLIVFMLALNGILVFIMTWWTVFPIKKLTKTTREIAQGKYDNRANVRTKDEIGLLAEDFNKMADSLEMKIQDLEKASIRQQDFIGSFAHELKTPLTSIIGYADMLRSKKMSDENKVLAADYIFNEGKRLESLSLKLLDLLVVKNLDFEMKRINMRNLFENIKGIMLPILENSDIQLQIAAEDIVICIEPDLMKTVIINLLDNAIKAISGKGEIILKGNRVSEERFIITVEDTGKGIAKRELSRITEAFYMVDKSRARASGGAGLGLALCREIAELHGGEITFESFPNIGTKVNLYLRG